MSTTTIKLPAKHARDWLNRYDGPDAAEVASTARTVTLELGDNALADLISDAHYYAEEMDPANTGDIDYRPAARACLRGIEGAGIAYSRRGFDVQLKAAGGTLTWTPAGDIEGRPMGPMVVDAGADSYALTFGHEWMHVTERLARDHAAVRGLAFIHGAGK